MILVSRGNTWSYNENQGLTGTLTGLNDAIYLRNTYQSQIDDDFQAIVDMVHYIENGRKKLIGEMNTAQAIKKNIEAHQQERADLYSSLNNLLTKETDFAITSIKTIQEGQKADTINLQQKIKDSDIEVQHGTMLQYLKDHPKYSSNPAFSTIQEQIIKKEQEIRTEKKHYNERVAHYNYLLQHIQKNIQKAEDKFAKYQKDLTEGTQRLQSCRYHSSIFYRFASEKRRDMVNLNTMNHRIDQFRNTLNIIKNEMAQYEGRKFLEIDY